MRKMIGPLAIVLILAAMLALPSAAMAVTHPQTWMLDRDLQMEKVGGLGDDGQSGQVTVPAGGSVIWLADEVAASNVTFPSGDWEADLYLDTQWAAHLSVRVGTSNGTTFTAFDASDVQVIAGPKPLIRILTQTGSETVPAGQYLALKISNSDIVAHTILTSPPNNASKLDSPCTDPGYPTPELASGILVGLGILGLAGYAFARRPILRRLHN